jgi:hypothetical protein
MTNSKHYRSNLFFLLLTDDWLSKL